MIAENLMGNKKLSAAEEERAWKRRMEDLMDKVVDVMKKVNGESDDDDDADFEMFVGPAPAPAPPADVEVSTATAHFATMVEDNVHKVITAAATPTLPKTSRSAVPGAAVIKQVRRASGKLLAAKRVADPPSPLH